MDEKHRSILRDLRLNIMKDLEPKCILPHLGRVFSETEEEEIRAQSTRQERCVTLLQILPRKGPLAFAAFVAALKKEAYHLAVELIEEDKKHIEKKFIGVRAQSAKLVRVITNLNAELDTQERSIETLEGVESDIVARHSNTREIPLQRDELKKQCESLAKHLEETHLVVSNLKKRLTTTFQDRATSTRDLEEFERTERRTEDDLCLAREHSEKLQGEIHQLKTEADKQDHIKTSQELEELKSRHEIAKAQTLQLADLVQQLRDERDSAARENQTSEKEIQEWKTKSEKYEQENQALQKSLESAMEIQEKLKLLSSDLETANKEQQEQIRQLQRMNEHKKGLEEGQDVEKLEKQRTITLQDKATSPRELKCKEGTSSDEHTLPKLQGMNTNRVVKIQRSEQQVPSGSSQTHSESSVHTSKINEEEKALTSKRNKQYLREIGETLINLIITTPHLTKEQQTAVYRILAAQVQTYQEFQDHSIDKQKGVGALTESIIGTYGLLLERFKISSMEQERKKKKK